MLLFRIIIAFIGALTAYFFVENSGIAALIGFGIGIVFVIIEYLCEKITMTVFLCAAFGIIAGYFLGILSKSIAFKTYISVLPLGKLPINHILLLHILFALLIIIVLARNIYVEKHNKNKTPSQPVLKSAGAKNTYEELLADMSVLEDGRILDFLKQEFPPIKIIIPDFVFAELKQNANAEEQMKKYRAKRGLETVSKLKENGFVVEKSYDKALISAKDLPSKTIELASSLNLRLATVSFVTGKTALLKKVKVLNLKVLSESLAPIYVPGDVASIFLVSEGSHQNQAVGFLNDGTKVIVAEGKRYINKVVRFIITAVVKNAAGKTIFGKVIENNRDHFHRNNNYKKEENNQ
jgi:uncharacterized protein YacL